MDEVGREIIYRFVECSPDDEKREARGEVVHGVGKVIA